MYKWVIIMKLKSNIGWLIDRSDYNREEISKIFNKSRNTVSNWCTGKSFPNTLDLFRLAKMLDVKVDDLYEVIEDDE
jgi:transcriptional regulator with XRE-family HTH domain